MNLLTSPYGTILIVDDESSFIKAMKRELFEEDFEIITAESGQEALLHLRDKPVDVVISDLKMIGMGGLEFIAEAQKILPYETQYMVMTGWGTLETAIEAMQLGVVNYLTKPIDATTLKDSIHTALKTVQSIRKTQQDYCEEGKKNALIFATVQAGVVLIEQENFTIVDANNAAATMLETKANHLVGKLTQQLFYQQDHSASAFFTNQLSKNSELELRTESGLPLPVHITTANIGLDNQDYLLVSFMDISQQKQVEADLKASQETFSAIVERSLDGIIILSSTDHIQFINSAAAKLFGKNKKDLLNQPFGFPATLGKPTELSFAPHGQTETIVEMCVAKTQWQGKTAMVATLRDITERKKLEKSIRQMATHDALTGLPNRNLLPDQLEKAIALARRNKQKMALLFVDLDNFKPINDNFGHSVGDIVLQKTAQRLIEAVRASDFVARVGGDEFVVVLQETGTMATAAIATQRIIDQVSMPLEIEGNICQLGASIGISLFPDHAETTDELMQKADAAMYNVKKKTKNSYCFYELGMDL